MIFTPEDYWKYKNLLPIEDDNVKNNDKINGDTYHYHDKIFKEILSNEEEILLLIRKYLGYDKSKEKRCGEVFLHRSFFGDAFARYNGPPHPFASL